MPYQLSQDDKMRLLGHRDGMVTAILRVKTQIANVERRYGVVDPRHHKKMARKAKELAPLQELLRIFTKEMQENLSAFEAQKTDA